MIRFKLYFKYFSLIFKNSFYNFTQFKFKDFKTLKNLIYTEDNDLIQKYELEFGKLIGKGTYISFGSGRMALYSILKVLELKNGDEVIVQALNCSVVINAIKRAECIPVYVDINEYDLGLNFDILKSKISTKTKVIIVQHSFGIPSDLIDIINFAKLKNIFIIEDCALTLGSKINDVNVGNFGDAAIFSTDQSKPINTLIGGGVYTSNKILIELIKNYQNNIYSFDTTIKKKLYKAIIFQNNFYNIKSYKYVYIVLLFKSFISKFIKSDQTIFTLNNDSSNSNINNYYPYPAKFPSLLAKVGILQILNFNKISKSRIDLFKNYINLFCKYGLQDLLPKSYFDPKIEIIPLRFIFFDREHKFEPLFSNIIDNNLILFKSPIVACNNPEKLNYYEGLCPNAEKICKMIYNLPLGPFTNNDKILQEVEKILKQAK